MCPVRGLFASVASEPGHRSAESLPGSLTVIGLLSVLGKPLALSLGDTAWVTHQLPTQERDLLVGRGIELLVPITSQTARQEPGGA